MEDSKRNNDSAVNPFKSSVVDSALPSKPSRRRWTFWLPTPWEFMVVVVTVFVVLVVWRRIMGPSAVWRPSFVVHQLFCGLTLAALPLWILRAKQGRVRRLQAGDWLWIAIALEQSLHLLMPLAFANTPLGEWEYPRGLAMILACVAAIYLLPVVMCSGLRWQLVGLPLALWNLYACVAVFWIDDFLLHGNRGLALLLALLALVVAVAIDFVAGNRYRWSHWCGLVIFVAWIAKQWWPVVQMLMGS